MTAIDPAHTALLVMDFQSDVVVRFGDKATPVVERAATLVAAARQGKALVVHVVIGFRPGYPELNTKNADFVAAAQSGWGLAGMPGTQIVDALRPAEAEPVIVKHRVSAFAGTDLDMILRAKGIDTLILTGIATSGVVLSTVRHAFDADYRLMVVKDACTDADDEVHRILIEKVFVRQALVISAGDLQASFVPA